jgi:hypothetical protein
MKRMRMAALVMAVTLISGLAVAQRDWDGDDDDYGRYNRGNAAQAQQYGYQNGYRDGVNKGREEGREHDRYDYRDPDWRRAERGYQPWMGAPEVYRRGYLNGYRAGFDSGYRSVNGRRRGDWNDGYYGRGGNGVYGNHGGWYGRAGYNSPGYSWGYRDGVEMAQHDIQKNNKYNAWPRGPFDDRDRGYQRQYGDKNEYKNEYAQGYRAGYDSTFRGYRQY